MLLIVPPSSLALGDVTFVVAVVDVWAQVLLVELEVEIVLIDFLFIVTGSCQVMTRFGTVSRVILAQLLGLHGGHVKTSSSLDNLRSLLEALEHLEHRGQVGRSQR